MSYPSFQDRYGAGQAQPTQVPAGPAGIAPPSADPAEDTNPWSKALDPMALAVQNPGVNISGGK